ncbi:MAG: hypothetical protein HVN34_01135 [Methanobacteriaceae archaeon]|jgi:hypothetical protein|nr:hypothetical protein [Methanobacteriaceae archaeon]
MDSKIIISILGLILLVIFASGCTSSGENMTNTTNTSKTYFVVDGPANLTSDVNVQVPIHKTTTEGVYFYYTPYKDGVASTGSWCTVPKGIDTTKTFNLDVNDPHMRDYDSLDILACQDEIGQIVLQKVHLKIQK